MANSEIKYVKHKRTNKVDFFGVPIAPKVDDIEVGEIALNYASGNEAFFIKNSDGEIVAMPTTRDIIKANDELNQNIDTLPNFSMKVTCDDGTEANIQILGELNTNSYGYGYGYGYANGNADYYNIGEWDDEISSLSEHEAMED